MLLKKDSIEPLVLISTILLSGCLALDPSVDNERNPNYLRVMVMHYPHVRTPEPYTYPGPSPTVKMPSKGSEPYMFTQPYLYRPVNSLDNQGIPKWCKSMWEREECGMKCWMLRKICRNIALQSAFGSATKDDSEGSSSIILPQIRPIHPYYAYTAKPTVSYSKTGVPNTYFAQPSWHYSYPKRSPYSYYKYQTNNEIGLNPQFTYVDGTQKLPIKSTTPRNEEVEESTTEVTTVTPKTEKPVEKSEEKPTRLKGIYPVKIKTQAKYPPDSEVTTLSPHMFEYDQYGTKGYYGDRIYMSAVMPVSDRQQREASPQDDNYDSFDDFDEFMIEP